MGGGQSKQKPAQQSDVTEYDMLKLKVKQQMQQYERQVNKLQSDAEKQQQLAKVALQEKNNDKSQYHLKLKRLCISQQQQLQNQLTILNQKYMMMRNVENMKAMTTTLEQVNNYMKDQKLDELNEQLQNVMQESNTQTLQVQQLEALMQQQNIDQDGIDEDLQRLADEIQVEQQGQFNVNAPTQQIKQQQAKQQTQESPQQRQVELQ